MGVLASPANSVSRRLRRRFAIHSFHRLIPGHVKRSEQGKCHICSYLVKKVLRFGDNPQVSLDEYRRKRRPGKTPEPFGDAKRRADRAPTSSFSGTPRGGSTTTSGSSATARWRAGQCRKASRCVAGERHLAVHVEDHPLEYGDFEGTIPAGEYGAGTVEIWDRGTYELLEEKRDGGLTVRLHGDRLDGVWTLVPAQLDGDPKNWLLLRKEGRRRARRGRGTTPMLATASETLPAGEGWVFEPKWDGFRAIVSRLGRRGRPSRAATATT